MSRFDNEALMNLEKLCRIKLTPQEEKAFLEQLKQIIDYVDQLSEIDTTEVQTCNYIQKDMQENIFREDIVKQTLTLDEFLSNCSEQTAGMIKVPPILKFE